jgi:hypothetical protein
MWHKQDIKEASRKTAAVIEYTFKMGGVDRVDHYSSWRKF